MSEGQMGTTEDLELEKAMKYVMRCYECGCTTFQAMFTGHISCANCGLTYTFIHAEPFKEWVFTALSPQDYIRMKWGKVWDDNKKEYRLMADIEKDRLKKIKDDKEKK